ncbi:hypothetical protein PYCC9005_005516 [Savitreella phatthalungensis]
MLNECPQEQAKNPLLRRLHSPIEPHPARTLMATTHDSLTTLGSLSSRPASASALTSGSTGPFDIICRSCGLSGDSLALLQAIMRRVVAGVLRHLGPLEFTLCYCSAQFPPSIPRKVLRSRDNDRQGSDSNQHESHFSSWREQLRGKSDFRNTFLHGVVLATS